jgi:hypothetical protein
MTVPREKFRRNCLYAKQCNWPSKNPTAGKMDLHVGSVRGKALSGYVIQDPKNIDKPATEIVYERKLYHETNKYLVSKICRVEQQSVNIECSLELRKEKHRFHIILLWSWL